MLFIIPKSNKFTTPGLPKKNLNNGKTWNRTMYVKNLELEKF